MSERCTFYRTEVRTVRGTPVRAGARIGPPTREHVAWCAHPGSVVPKGADRPLTCKGDLALCLIPEKLVS